MKAATRSEDVPSPLNMGTIFQTSSGPNFEYWAIVISKKNRGKPIIISNVAKAITNAPFMDKLQLFLAHLHVILKLQVKLTSSVFET